MSIEGGGVVSGSVLAAMQKAAQTNATARAAMQEETAEDLLTRETGANPYAGGIRRQSKTLERHTQGVRKGSSAEEKDDVDASPLGKIQEKAKEFQEKNGELKEKFLKLLRGLIKPGDKKEDVLRKVQDFYGDISLVDEALDFLVETTDGDLQKEVSAAKADINQHFAREITAGRNVGNLARSFSEKGLGDPSGLRDLYRDITGNPRDPRALFDELTKQFPYKKLQTVIKFLFHSIGTDLRAKGSSISPGLLTHLMTETRTLQMILGVYRFFSKRMDLVNSLFEKNGIIPPAQITFENLAKMFMQLTGDRYPSTDRILRLARLLGIDDNTAAKIIVFSQFRDAVNEVDGSKIFRSTQHRYEVMQAIIESLEELEDDLELLDDEAHQESKLKAKEDSGV